MSSRKRLSYAETLHAYNRSRAGLTGLIGEFVFYSGEYMVLRRAICLATGLPASEAALLVVPVGENRRLLRWLVVGDKVSLSVVFYGGKVLRCKAHSLQRVVNEEKR